MSGWKDVKRVRIEGEADLLAGLDQLAVAERATVGRHEEVAETTTKFRTILTALGVS